ncbi:hypothetical protein Aperf_G00000112732 [Anoplocephala perfoliata]
MAFNRRPALIVLLLLVLDHLFFSSLAAILPASDDEFNGLQRWKDFVHETVDCEQHPDSPECEDRSDPRRRTTDCAYTVFIRSKIFQDEEATLCARPRHSLSCQINGGAECQVPPMEVSDYDLLVLYVVNHELQARILRLQNQHDTGLELSRDIQREVEQIIADNVAWLCSRKCNNSSCEFDAEMQPQRRAVGSISRMTSLVTDYPFFPRATRHDRIEIYFPIGSHEISRLLRKASPFRHLAVSSLPLTVSCQKNYHKL